MEKQQYGQFKIVNIEQLFIQLERDGFQVLIISRQPVTVSRIFFSFPIILAVLLNLNVVDSGWKHQVNEY